MPFNEIRSQQELNLKIKKNGDIVGLHHLPPLNTKDGIVLVLSRDLIPELKGPEETALGRKLHPQALLAQSVDSNELVAAVNAGADVLVASKLLSQQEINAARYEASKKGKFISIIVGIDPTAPGARDQIHLAVALEADGIKFKPAGKMIEKTKQCIDFTKEAYPELLLMVAGGVKANNRSFFSVKAGVGADSLDEINALIPWAKKGVISNSEVVASMMHAIDSCSGWHDNHKKLILGEHLAAYLNNPELMSEESYMDAIRAFVKETIQERKTWKSIFQAQSGETKSFAAFYNSLTPIAKNIVSRALHCDSNGSIEDFRIAALCLRPNTSSIELPRMAP